MKPRHLIYVVLGGLLALSLGVGYTTRCNPELRWLDALHRVKQAASERPGAGRILVSGGSTVLFGIDAAALAQTCGRPAVNLGLHAGMGALAILGYAAQAAREGDLLVLSLEPDLLAGEVQPQRLGNQFMVLAGLGSMALGGATPLLQPSPARWLSAHLDVASPGLRQLVNHAGKALLGRPAYRYQDLHADALGFLPDKLTIAHPPAGGQAKISPAWLAALRTYVAAAEARGVRVVYSLPWFETLGDPATECQTYLTKLNTVLPIVQDFAWPELADPLNFSDTAGHLSVQGAARRTAALGQALAAGRLAPRVSVQGSGAP